MKIFLADGGLGNQIFQYVFLKTIKDNNEKIIVSGFEDLREVFEIDDIVILNAENKWFRDVLYRLCMPVLKYLGDRRIISSIAVNHETVLDKYRRETATFTRQKGLFYFITFVKPGFFQSEKFFDRSVLKQLKIKDRYLEEADKFLQNIPQNNQKIFVHIRRGDYKDHTVYGKSTLLPMSYFNEQIEWFLENRENPFFIFLSNEHEFINKEFKFIENKLISSNNHYGTDLAIMTKCHSAILSPSSFGWWGSYLMEDTDTVFAPEYWLGFNSGMEYHCEAIPSIARKVAI